jgi:hypothetical protein
MVFALSNDFVTVADTKDVPVIIIPVIFLNTFYFSLFNMRKLSVAPSVLIVVALMPYANAQTNFTGSQRKLDPLQLAFTI